MSAGVAGSEGRRGPWPRRPDQPGPQGRPRAGRTGPRRDHAAARARRPRGRPFGPLAVLLLLSVLSPLLPLSPAGAAAELSFPYRSLRTGDIRLVFYDSEHLYLAPHLVRCFENSMRFHRRLFDYTPSEEVTVFLNDADDFGYAGTTSIPNNYLTLGIEPFEYVYETCPTNERFNWVMMHELLHVAASDQAAGSDRFFRRLFRGKVAPIAEDPISIFYSYLTTPRRYAPRWYHEGLAVFMETWMAGGIGRALGGYDEMVFRAMVRDGSFFYDVVGIESEGTTIDFQLGQNAYLYGTRFMSYLALHHGPEQVVAWARRGPGDKRYFSSQFRHVFGLPLEEGWGRWIAFEHDWQRANLDTIRAHPVTPWRDLSPRALGSVSRPYFDAQRRLLYAAVNYPGEFAHIAEIEVDTWRRRKICEVPTPAMYYVCSLAWDEAAGVLFYTTDNSRRWRDLNAVDIASGKTRRLLRNCRIGDLAFDRASRALWGVQHHNGKTRLVRVPPPYDDWQELLLLPYGRDLFDIDVSPDGRWLSGTLVDVTGRQRLIRMDISQLLAGDTGYEALWEFKDNIAANFTFTPDGRHLVGTSYYTGCSNVFRFDLQEKKLEALSNAETGLFRPIAAGPDSLIAFRYTGQGFVPAMIPAAPLEDVSAIRYLGQAVVARHPVVKSWMLGSPAAVEIDTTSFAPSPYNGLRELRLMSAYPIVEGYKDHAAGGVRLNFMDPAGLNALDAAFTWSPGGGLPDDQRPHARLRYRRFPWTVSASWNRADFYDLFGPTKTGRKGTSLAAGYDLPLVSESPRALDASFGLAAHRGLERLPAYQNIATDFGEFYTGSAALAYSRLRKTIGGIEPEKGIAWGLSLDGTAVKGDVYPQLSGTLDVGFLLPWDHSSLWLRTAGGQAFGDRDSPFAAFYFGGFGNNWVDHREVNRYREWYSFPGLELNEAGGRNFAKSMLEWTLPPLRFRRVGVSALYANWARLALFAHGLATDLDRGAQRREWLGLGGQLNLKLVVFSSLESTLSLGYAMAIADGRRPADEVMASLKILR